MSESLKSALVGLLPRLRRYGLSLSGSQADGDDLVQAACERALMRLDQLRSGERLDRWVYAIMRRIWLDEFRSRRVRRHETIDAAEKVAGDDGAAIAESRITFTEVRAAMGSLPEDQRTVLMLVCVDGLSYKDAAELLEIPVGTVMSRLSRGRQELERRLCSKSGLQESNLLTLKLRP